MDVRVCWYTITHTRTVIVHFLRKGFDTECVRKYIVDAITVHKYTTSHAVHGTYTHKHTNMLILANNEEEHPFDKSLWIITNKRNVLEQNHIFLLLT